MKSSSHQVRLHTQDYYFKSYFFFCIEKSNETLKMDELYKEKLRVKELEEKIKKICEENQELKNSLRVTSDKVVTLESERQRFNNSAIS
jgi:predicted RNase H-like nuclease (RuvC/YqgF family)